MDLQFYIFYVIFPFALSIAYWQAKRKENKKSQRTFKSLKGVFYLYLVIATLLQGIEYSQGLTIVLAIMEGMGCLIEVLTGE